MKINRMFLAVAGFTLVPVFFIGWVFYQSLQLNSENTQTENDYPQKNVMVQAQELNYAYLTGLAEKGQVVKGMTAEHVRTALGRAERVEEETINDIKQTTWWYKKEGWMGVVFKNNKVVQIIQP